MKTALILGGTGLVGSHVVDLLISNPNYKKIYVLSRREKHYQSEKVHVIVTDFNDLSMLNTIGEIDSIFSCLGTTKQLTPSREKYLFIELGIPQKVITLLEKNNNLPEKIHVCSAIGANSASRNFYMKMKGDLEAQISCTAISYKYFYQPAVILGEREREERWWEKLAAKASRLLDKMLKGDSMKYHTIHAKEIAEAMIRMDNSIAVNNINKLTYQEMI